MTDQIMPTHLNRDALRDDVSTIAHAICKIRNLPEPDESVIDRIALHVMKNVEDLRPRDPKLLAGLLVEHVQIALG